MNTPSPLLTSLQAYCQVFATLTPQSVSSDLAPLLAETVYFEDPFNQLYGKAETLRLFSHMFATVQQPQFSVLDFALSAETQGYIYWKFTYRRNHQLHHFKGVSKITFDEDGLVQSHIDFWDPAKAIYQSLPVIGGLLRWLERKIALPKNWHPKVNH
ncbi:MAG: nuclear transport factor 2 family protein [Thiotrichales bacterium]|nr:nuclear transport factor 2 family protein [Thiotrichales bacterium]